MKRETFKPNGNGGEFYAQSDIMTTIIIEDRRGLSVDWVALVNLKILQ